METPGNKTPGNQTPGNQNPGMSSSTSGTMYQGKVRTTSAPTSPLKEKKASFFGKVSVYVSDGSGSTRNLGFGSVIENFIRGKK